MPSRNNDFTATEVMGDDFAAALENRQAVTPTTTSVANVPAQVDNIGSAPAQLRTSASVDGFPSHGVSMYSVSDIMQGAGLHKSPALMSDQFNQILSSDMGAILNTGGGAEKVLGVGRQQGTPYDVLIQQGTTDGKITFDVSSGGGVAENAANANSTANPPATLTENPDGTRTYVHPNWEGTGQQHTLTLVTWEGFTLAQEFMARWQPLIRAAQADGIEITGGGWRSYEEQINLRREHCGSSDYAIYEMRSSECSPPTARPGHSNHEGGCAVDVSNCGTGTDRYQWLVANAGRFGVYNLPSESWHWSIDGS